MIDFAKTYEIEAGHIVEVTGFTCIKEGEIRCVHKDCNDKLYITCDRGKHFLDGQIDDNDCYVGIELRHIL